MPRNHNGNNFNGYDYNWRRRGGRRTVIVVNNNYAQVNATAYNAELATLYAAQTNMQVLAAQLMTAGGLIAPVYPYALAPVVPVLPPVIPPLAPYGPIAPIRPFRPWVY